MTAACEQMRGCACTCRQKQCIHNFHAVGLFALYVYSGTPSTLVFLHFDTRLLSVALRGIYYMCSTLWPPSAPNAFFQGSFGLFCLFWRPPATCVWSMECIQVLYSVLRTCTCTCANVSYLNYLQSAMDWAFGGLLEDHRSIPKMGRALVRTRKKDQQTETQ